MDLNPLNQIQPVVIVSAMAIFGFVLFALRKLYFLPYIEVMERRALRLDEAAAQEAEADRLVGEAQSEADSLLTEAREEADRVLREAREASERRRREILEKANVQAAASLEKGRSRLASARTTELSSLRQEAVDCVAIACEKLLGEPNDEAAAMAVDRVIARKIH
jgi:F-type H+-transporting ATPase subunit b